VKELEVCGAKGYPDQDDLKVDETLLRFYTGVSSFTVLTAVFNLVSAAIQETSVTKLAKFQCLFSH
jgi:hypothetical protein